MGLAEAALTSSLEREIFLTRCCWAAGSVVFGAEERVTGGSDTLHRKITRRLAPERRKFVQGPEGPGSFASKNRNVYLVNSSFDLAIDVLFVFNMANYLISGCARSSAWSSAVPWSSSLSSSSFCRSVKRMGFERSCGESVNKYNVYFDTFKILCTDTGWTVKDGRRKILLMKQVLR